MKRENNNEEQVTSTKIKAFAMRTKKKVVDASMLFTDYWVLKPCFA